LENAGYQTIREIKENNNIQTWQKLVSLCPLKYWINW
jgi:hypothetical protein